LDRVQFNERIAHLQRRARLQRRIIEQLAGREVAAPLADMQTIFLALEEMEERNLVLEDVVKTARAQISTGAFPGSVLGPLPKRGVQSAEVSAVGDPASLIHALRLEAERLRAEGNYKSARRLLRRVRSRKVLTGSGLQMLAVSKYRIIRRLFSFYRYF
jgi:hypothetical protein